MKKIIFNILILFYYSNSVICMDLRDEIKDEEIEELKNEYLYNLFDTLQDSMRDAIMKGNDTRIYHVFEELVKLHAQAKKENQKKLAKKIAFAIGKNW